jgi:acyl-CoA reductase-like NAD-dependent aldehyde dehydrogenase
LGLIDKDLQSIQEVRNLIHEAKKAQKILAGFSQQQIDRICQAISEETYNQREKLAKMANQETGFGVWQDKMIKNSFASKTVYEYIKDMRTELQR